MIKDKYQTVEEKADPKAVRRARGEEIEYVRKMNLYKKVPPKQCYERIGKGPITIRWVDVKKGDNINPNYRSRLVAREINPHKRDDLFAGTPPLEALKCIMSIIANGNNGEVLTVNNVSRAFFHAKARREAYVQLVEENELPGDENKCGLLSYSMYGTRDAAQNWASEYADMLVSVGFLQGKAYPRVFHHKENGALGHSCMAATTLARLCPNSSNGSRNNSRRGTQ